MNFILFVVIRKFYFLFEKSVRATIYVKKSKKLIFKYGGGRGGGKYALWSSFAEQSGKVNISKDKILAVLNISHLSRELI
jgi:hypothetical protein